MHCSCSVLAAEILSTWTLARYSEIAVVIIYAVIVITMSVTIHDSLIVPITAVPLTRVHEYRYCKLSTIVGVIIE